MRTEEAKRTLRKVAKHMRESMTPAARVRRDFNSGRPAKAESLQLMHPVEAWQRANAVLNDLKARMSAADLKPEHAEGMLVYIKAESPFQPEHIPVLPEYTEKAFEVFSRADAFVLGVALRQYDAEAGKYAYFVRQIQPLPDQGIEVLRMGTALLAKAVWMANHPN